MNGPMIGLRTENGAMVSSRYSATFERAWPVDTEKNSVPDNAMATSASPALEAAWTPANRWNASRGERGREPRSGCEVLLVRVAPFRWGTIAAGCDVDRRSAAAQLTRC